MILVDNAVYSFGAQLSNGIPIIPFKDDTEDREFLFLMNYLKLIKDADDLRKVNREAFKMEQVYQFNLDKFINYYDYDQCNEKSGDEYSDNEEKDQPQCFSEHLGTEEPTTESESNPFGSGSSSSYPKEKSNSMGSSS